MRARRDLSTKYTAASLAIGPSVAMAIGTARMRAWKGMAVFAATALAITAQHWLRNWIFYGDPIYPVMAEYFQPHPWTVDSDRWHRTFQEIKTIPDTLLVHGIGDLLRVLATFSFDVHDYPSFHGKVPVFGSLFTFATVALPFLRRTRRAWAVTLATYVGMTYWALLTPQDRYLQALLPWMVEFAVVDPTCDIPAHGLDAFVMVARRGPYQLYARPIGAAESY